MEKLNLGSFKHSSEWLEIQRNIHEKRRKLKQLHDDIMRMEKQRNYSNTVMQNKLRQYNDTAQRLTKEVKKKNREIYLKWANRILLVWKKRQISLLKEKFNQLIPQSTFYINDANYSKRKVLIRPHEAKLQSEALVIVIVDTVYKKLKDGIEKYEHLPFGGNIGNWRSIANKGEVQCSDKNLKGWSDIIRENCKKEIDKWMLKDKNAFRMIWINTSKTFLHGEHNWVEFRSGKTKMRIIIDPWPSGGREIYSKKPYKNREGKPGEIYPNRERLPTNVSNMKKSHVKQQ